MTADECSKRAAACADNAAIAADRSVAREFLSLAAQWRALAVREILPGLGDSSKPPVGRGWVVDDMAGKTLPGPASE